MIKIALESNLIVQSLLDTYEEDVANGKELKDILEEMEELANAGILTEEEKGTVIKELYEQQESTDNIIDRSIIENNDVTVELETVEPEITDAKEVENEEADGNDNDDKFEVTALAEALLKLSQEQQEETPEEKEEGIVEEKRDLRKGGSTRLYSKPV